MSAERPSAGKLRERVTLSSRLEINPDGPLDLGNTQSDWIPRATVWAEFIHLRGGEAVIAGRLQGRHSQIIRVRASSLTREVATDWQVTDARTGVEYAVRDVTLTVDRAWVEMLVETGAAA